MLEEQKKVEYTLKFVNIFYQSKIYSSYEETTIEDN